MSEDFPALAGFRAGSLVAGYRLEAPVGAGGFAVVFRARDQRLGRLVALKILAPTLAADAAFRRRFIAESRAAAAVDDPHIIPVHEAGEAGGVLFIAMRFVPGGDLRRVLVREDPLAPGRAAELLSPVASALDAAHAAGLVHRDVKPANILVDARPGRPDHVYLSDFGVSKGAVSSVSLTGTGQFLGTPDYSAPEQIEGRTVDGRADQYALACVAYQMLAGAVPFQRDQGMAVLLAHLSAPPPSLSSRRPGLPGAADDVLARGMAKAPEERYGSCQEFADALREALGLAPYYPLGTAAASDHPQTEITPPLSGLPGPAAAGTGTAAVLADLAAATTAGTATAGPPVTQTAPSPARPAPSPAAAEPEAAVPAGPAAAATPAGTATAVPPVTKTAPSPADFGRAVTAGAVGSRGDAGTEPSTQDRPAQSSRKRPRRRHRALIITTTATVAVIAGIGTLLAAHPWIHPVLKPTGLAVESATTDHSGTADSVEITWSGPATGPLPDNYEIFRNSTEVGTVLGTETSYTDDGLTPDTSYDFQVIAVRGGTQSPVSATLTVQAPPLRPTGLGVKRATTSSLEIAWSGPAAGPPPASYEILRNGTEITTVPGSTTSYTDTGLAPDTAYSYQVIAVTGSKRSPASATLTSASTAKPPLSAAVLSWSGQVTEKMTSLNPADSIWPLQPGKSTQDTWTLSPDCSSGPCDATLTGAWDGLPFTAKLTRSGTTYTGTAELKNDWSCGNQSNSYSPTLTINITVNAADTQADVWTATSFSGNETVYTPAAYTCYADTGHLDVKSS